MPDERKYTQDELDAAVAEERLLNSPKMMGIMAVAAALDVSESSIRRWSRNGVMPAPKVIGGCHRWPVAELVEWEKNLGMKPDLTLPDNQVEVLDSCAADAERLAENRRVCEVTFPDVEEAMTDGKASADALFDTMKAADDPDTP